MRRHPCAIIALAAFAGHAHAQSVTITASHDDPDGIVAPGQGVTISFNIFHTGFHSVGDWSGDAAIAPAGGTVTNPVYAVGSPFVTTGTPGPGGITGIAFQGLPPAFAGGGGFNPPWLYEDFEFLRCTWTAPSEPGVYNFDWTPAPQFPVVQGYQTTVSVALTPYPTTYLGATLTVIPAPAAAPLLLAAALAPRRRR